MFFFIFIQPVGAEQSLIPMGHTVEVKLQYEHVVVSEQHKLGSGTIEQGDLLLELDGKKIESLKDVPKRIQKERELQLAKVNQSYRVTIQPAEWTHFYFSLKDNTDGIGTMTYIETSKQQFGALGHAIEDSRIPTMPKIIDGRVYLTSVNSIHKSEKGVPGYKVTKSDPYPVGQVSSNTIVGVFGKWQHPNEIRLAKPIKIMQQKDIQLGAASILTQVDEDQISEFFIEITSVSTEGILFEVVDEQLLAKTGGIVQGMSGSPIIQNKQFVGAVTHMFVENPSKGAAIWIGEMIKDA